MPAEDEFFAKLEAMEPAEIDNLMEPFMSTFTFSGMNTSSHVSAKSTLPKAKDKRIDKIKRKIQKDPHFLAELCKAAGIQTDAQREDDRRKIEVDSAYSSAQAAAFGNNIARKANRIACWSLGISILALIGSAIAIWVSVYQ